MSDKPERSNVQLDDARAEKLDSISGAFERDPATQVAEASSSPSTRWLFVSAGWGALALGAVGIVLPVLPTTPLVLVAAWCFARGSKRLHRRLLDHRTFGPLVRKWEAHGVIPRPAKILATAMIVVVVGPVLLFGDVPAWARISTLALVAAGLLFIWSRPSRPEGDEDAEVAGGSGPRRGP